MKLLDKLVIKDLIPMFGFSIALFTSLWFAGGPILEAVRNLASGIPVFIVLRLLILNVPVVLALTFPMAVVLAVLNGYGRISADSEAVAIYAGGIPFARAAMPAVMFGLLASLAGFLLNNFFAVEANHQITSLKETALKQIASDKPIVIPPIMKDGKLAQTILIGKITQQNAGILQDVTVTIYDKSGAPSQIIYARQARWKEDVQWVLYDAQANYLGEHAAYVQMSGKTVVDFHTTPDTLALLNADTSTLSFAQLKKQVRGLRAGGFFSEARKSELAMWRIVALPFASLVFALIGSPLGLRPQRTSKATGWGLAVLIIFGYYVLYMVTGSMSDGGTLPPIIAAFAPDIIGLVVGAALVYRAST